MNKKEMQYKRLSPNEIIDGINELIKDRQSFLSGDEQGNKVFLEDINLLKNIKENLCGLAKESIDYKSKFEQLEDKFNKAMKLIDYLDSVGLIQDEESFVTLCELRGEDNED